MATSEEETEVEVEIFSDAWGAQDWVRKKLNQGYSLVGPVQVSGLQYGMVFCATVIRERKPPPINGGRTH